MATHGTEFWILNKYIAKRLAAFKRKVLGRMSGGIKANEMLTGKIPLRRRRYALGCSAIEEEE